MLTVASQVRLADAGWTQRKAITRPVLGRPGYGGRGGAGRHWPGVERSVVNSSHGNYQIGILCRYNSNYHTHLMRGRKYIA